MLALYYREATENLKGKPFYHVILTPCKKNLTSTQILCLMTQGSPVNTLTDCILAPDLHLKLWHCFTTLPISFFSAMNSGRVQYDLYSDDDDSFCCVYPKSMAYATMRKIPILSPIPIIYLKIHARIENLMSKFVKTISAVVRFSP